MLFLGVLAVALLTVRPAGGRFTTLSHIRVRAAWLVVVALLLQIVTISVLVHPSHRLAALLHLLSYGAAAVFLGANWRLRGLLVVAAGGALNLAAIAANGGTMPASTSALRLAGISGDGEHFANSATLAAPRLRLLGDIFAVPQWAGLFANVFSAGDVILSLGALWLLHAGAGCGWATRKVAAVEGPAGGPTAHSEPLPVSG